MVFKGKDIKHEILEEIQMNNNHNNNRKNENYEKFKITIDRRDEKIEKDTQVKDIDKIKNDLIDEIYQKYLKKLNEKIYQK